MHYGLFVYYQKEKRDVQNMYGLKDNALAYKCEYGLFINVRRDFIFLILYKMNQICIFKQAKIQSVRHVFIILINSIQFKVCRTVHLYKNMHYGLFVYYQKEKRDVQNMYGLKDNAVAYKCEYGLFLNYSLIFNFLSFWMFVLLLRLSRSNKK
jgi:hypothetical protein